jgi:hypothetical protein
MHNSKINIIAMTDSSSYYLKLMIEPSEDEDEEDLENSTRILVNELNEIEGVDNVSYITKEERLPEGARAGEIVNLGELVMSFITSGALVASLNLVSSWLQNRKRKIKIETKNGTIETDNLSKDELENIINLMKVRE